MKKLIFIIAVALSSTATQAFAQYNQGYDPQDYDNGFGQRNAINEQRIEMEQQKERLERQEQQLRDLQRERQNYEAATPVDRMMGHY